MSQQPSEKAVDDSYISQPPISSKKMVMVSPEYLSAKEAQITALQAKLTAMGEVVEAGKKLSNNINEFGKITDQEIWDDFQNALDKLDSQEGR